MKRVAFCYPTLERPTDAFLHALEGSLPLLDGRYEHAAVAELGCPYISAARATMIRKAMEWGADIFIFLDDDVSWRPEDLVALIDAEGDVAGGTYRFKVPQEGSSASVPQIHVEPSEYMGKVFVGDGGKPLVRDTDGAIQALCLPAGFLKVTRLGIARFMAAYPELSITGGGSFNSPDLFNHGAYKGVWYGEDYAFCRRWMELGGELFLLPNLNLDHHGKGKWEGHVWPGNFHEHLLKMGRDERMKEAA